MCKHVAAVLYGAGMIFDTDPMLLFKLRGVNIESLILKSIDDKIEMMLNNVGRPSPRILGDGAEEMFGVMTKNDQV